MNKVQMIGRLIKDPDVKTSGSGNSYINFTIAVNRKFKDASGQTQSDFFDCKAFKKTAEFIGQYFSKGERIGICGTLQTDTWQDNEGKNRKSVYILVDEVEFIESKKSNGSNMAPINPMNLPKIEGADKKVQASLDFFGAMAEGSSDGGSLPFEV